MRHLQPLMVDGLIAIHQDIEVDISRPLVDELLTTHGPLDILQLIQESQWLKRCLNLQTRSA